MTTRIRWYCMRPLCKRSSVSLPFRDIVLRFRIYLRAPRCVRCECEFVRAACTTSKAREKYRATEVVERFSVPLRTKRKLTRDHLPLLYLSQSPEVCVLQVQTRHRDQHGGYTGLSGRPSRIREEYVCPTSAWRFSPLNARYEGRGIALTSPGQRTDAGALRPQKSSRILCWQ